MRVRRLSAAEVQAAVVEYLARRGERVLNPRRFRTALIAPATLSEWEVETVACEPTEVRASFGAAAVRTTFEALEPAVVVDASEH